MSPRFVLGRENVPCVAEVVNRSLKADCTDFNKLFINRVSSICTVKYKALSLHVQPSQVLAVQRTAGFVFYSTDLAPG